MKHLTPQQAWSWLQAETARRAAEGQEAPLFVDVRAEIESLGEGRPPGAENMPCYGDPSLTLEAAGLPEVWSVVRGFEGGLDSGFKRSSINGWRHDGRPWERM